jgi:hypothetical protein
MLERLEWLNASESSETGLLTGDICGGVLKRGAGIGKVLLYGDCC